MLRTLRDTLWILALAIIVLFAFFVALGAFSPGDVMEVTIGVAILVVAWVAHAVLNSRRDSGGLDPEAMRARERRGF
jgi:fatty acid desaturase